MYKMIMSLFGALIMITVIGGCVSAPRVSTKEVAILDPSHGVIVKEVESDWFDNVCKNDEREKALIKSSGTLTKQMQSQGIEYILHWMISVNFKAQSTKGDKSPVGCFRLFEGDFKDLGSPKIFPIDKGGFPFETCSTHGEVKIEKDNQHGPYAEFDGSNYITCTIDLKGWTEQLLAADQLSPPPDISAIQLFTDSNSELYSDFVIYTLAGVTIPSDSNTDSTSTLYPLTSYVPDSAIDGVGMSWHEVSKQGYIESFLNGTWHNSKSKMFTAQIGEPIEWWTDLTTMSRDKGVPPPLVQFAWGEPGRTPTVTKGDPYTREPLSFDIGPSLLYIGRIPNLEPTTVNGGWRIYDVVYDPCDSKPPSGS